MKYLVAKTGTKIKEYSIKQETNIKNIPYFKEYALLFLVFGIRHEKTCELSKPGSRTFLWKDVDIRVKTATNPQFFIFVLKKIIIFKEEI